MWTIIKFDKDKLHFLKEDLSKKLGKDYKIYDPNNAEHPNHNHIICNDCDKIIEFESDKLEALENEITSKLGFEVESQQLTINASCEEMKRAGACKNKED